MPSAEEISAIRRYRLAHRRDAVGLTQDDLADAVGRSRQTVGRWEAGTSDPTPRVRPALAKALRVSLDELNFILVPGHVPAGAGQTFHTDGEPVVTVSAGGPEQGDPVDRRHFMAIAGATVAGAALTPASTLQELVLVLVEPGSGASSGDDLTIASLGRGVADVERAYQACEYDTVVAQLPALLDRIKAGNQFLAGDDRRRLAGLASQAHHVAAGVLLKLNNPGVASIAADRSIEAARRSEDPVMVGASARIVTHTLMASGQMDAAHSYASSRADDLSGELLGPEPGALSVYGALLLRGASAAGKAENASAARTLLDEAEETALRLGNEGNHHWTAFGTANVLAHRMAVEISLGNAGNAIDYLRRIELDQLGIVERRVVVCIDAARAYSQWGKHDRALSALQAAEQVSSTALRLRPVAKDVVHQIRSTGPASVQPGLRDLVERVGIAA